MTRRRGPEQAPSAITTVEQDRGQVTTAARLPVDDRAEQVLAAAATLSKHAASVIVDALDGVVFGRPSCRRVIEHAHRLHQTGWPEGMWLEERVDAIASAADVWPAELRAWTHACPTLDESTLRRWALRVRTAARERDEVIEHAAALGELLGHHELSTAVDDLTDAMRRWSVQLREHAA